MTQGRCNHNASSKKKKKKRFCRTFSFSHFISLFYFHFHIFKISFTLVLFILLMFSRHDLSFFMFLTFTILFWKAGAPCMKQYISTYWAIHSFFLMRDNYWITGAQRHKAVHITECMHGSIIMVATLFFWQCVNRGCWNHTLLVLINPQHNAAFTSFSHKDEGLFKN